MCFFTFFTFIWVFVIIFIISIKLSIEWNSYYFYYLTRTLICENILNPLPTSKYWRVHWWNLILHYYQVFIHYFLYSQNYSYVSLFIIRHTQLLYPCFNNFGNLSIKNSNQVQLSCVEYLRRCFHKQVKFFLFSLRNYSLGEYM